MGAPIQTKSLPLMADKLDLRVHYSGWHARMFCAIKDHDSCICTHGCYDVGILRLIASLVDLAFVINLLDNCKLHFRRRRLLSRTASISSDLFSFLIVVLGFWCGKVRQLNVGNLKIILRLARSVCAKDESMGRVTLVRRPCKISLEESLATGD